MAYRHEISNSDDVIDSRDVIARIDELENDENLDLVEVAELDALKALAEEAEQYAEDWSYGSTLIRDSYFTDYAEELCKDIGQLPRDIPDYIVIDWEATAENLKADYTSVDFDGVEYWVR
jgi:hypothetical protein